MRRILAPFTLLLAIAPAAAQQPHRLTADDYARAERFLSWNTEPLVMGADVRPTWLAGDRFWYRTRTPRGFEFVLIDAPHRTRAPAFDQAGVAAGLSAAADTTYDAYHLPFARFEFTTDGAAITFEARGRRWRCAVRGASCTTAPDPHAPPPNSVVSPDGRLAAFIRDQNLWVRDLAAGTDTRLTTDGVRDFGYATDNAGWIRGPQPVLRWSPDSRRIATFQQDQRGVGEMYLVHTRVGHPVLDAWKYPLPGDSVVTTIQRVVVDVDPPRVVRFGMPPDQHRSTVCDHVLCRGRFADVEWYPDGSHVAFVSTSRDHRDEHLRVADAATGTVRDVLEEHSPDFFESGYNAADWRVLPASNAVIWYSERDDWGHLYLYDLATGRLEHRITSGDWNVLQVLRVDERARTITFTGAGREPGDPYFRHLYRIRFDGTHLESLTPDSADHDVSLSPDGRFILDSRSRPDAPPVTVLRSASGAIRMTLERADLTRLRAAGWVPPIPITVMARDGRTALYGLMYRPSDFDSTRVYPIIDHVYPGPQVGSVGSRSFRPSHGDAQALAELGFIVVEIDAMGTPLRSHAFHAAYYGDMGDNGLPDQIAAIRQLARRHAWIDATRVGIYGHSGGGYASADAILRYPDFFKVAVAEAGNHDNRVYEDDWGEKWQGLLVRHPGGGDSYDNQANESLAANLRGKLLLAVGSTDDNVPPYNTLLVVDSLIAHNKDFDLIVLPNRRHGFGNEPYMIRRRWDYFVRYLLGARPPAGFAITGPAAGTRR